LTSMAVALVDHMGSDLTVVNAARVSFGKHSDVLDEKDEKLITYLAEHGHWSPFAHAFIQFRIKAPIFVARQLVKHQVGLTWNEISRRYVDDEPEFYRPKVWRGRASNNKQGSEGVVKVGGTTQDVVAHTILMAQKHYRKLLEEGVAPEMARMILPQNTMTEWYWSGSLHAFARVCSQRLDHHSQQETQAIAALIHQHCQQLYPISWAALTKEQYKIDD